MPRRLRKRLTIILDAEVYQALYQVVGRGKISRYIEDLIRPHLLPETSAEPARPQAKPKVREAEALSWMEAALADKADKK
jgi:hypothetical protein